MLVPVAGLVAVAISFTLFHYRHLLDRTPSDIAALQHIAALERENAELSADLSRRSQSVLSDQREIKNLQQQSENEGLRHSGEPARGATEQSSNQRETFMGDAGNQERLSAEVKEEVARSGQQHFNDDAIVQQQLRIAELTNKLRLVSATLDQERQLASAGNDVRELMASRKLHVIDVRDSDANGNPGPAFGRVFFTEGKSLTFYAFDLDRATNAKHNFEVWAAPETGKNAPRSLGFLEADAKTPGRWVLKVENPGLVNQISSVFVTVEPAIDSKQPNGPKLLYAYLGDANHP
jgi:hypothetical protein